MPDGLPTWTTISSNQRWQAGTSSGFSTIPTMAQINASSHLNQIVAFLNRKQSQITGAMALGYAPGLVNQTIGAAYLGSIATAIDALRSAVGLSTGFTNSLSANHPWSAAWLTECQQKLDLSHTVSLGGSKTWRNTGGVYPALGASNTYAALPGGFGTFTIGKISATPNTSRGRLGIYKALNTIGSDATATLNYTPFNSANGETFTPRLYVSNTDDSAFSAGWEANLDNNAGDGVYGDSTQHVTIPNAILAARSGAVMSMILGISTEMTNGGAGLVNASFDITNFFDVPATLTFNY